MSPPEPLGLAARAAPPIETSKNAPTITDKTRRTMTFLLTRVCRAPDQEQSVATSFRRAGERTTGGRLDQIVRRGTGRRVPAYGASREHHSSVRSAAPAPPGRACPAAASSPGSDE